MNSIRKVVAVIIDGKTYDVYSIDGKEHPGYNGEPTSWWVYFADPLPGGAIPPIDSEYWVPYSNSIERLSWELRFRTINSSKYKWNDVNFRSAVQVDMMCNGVLVNQFTCGDMAYAIAKAQTMMVDMVEHPYNFINPSENKGRKIYFYGLPATIEPSSYYGGEIHIIPDYNEISKEEWWDRYRKARPWESAEDDEDHMTDKIAWGSALSDGNIWWFREDNNDD